MNFGDYEGKFIDELKKEKDYYTLWNEPQGDFSIKNGETYQEVVDRVLDFIEEKYKENKKCIFITIPWNVIYYFKWFVFKSSN